MYVEVEGARLWIEQDGAGTPILVPTGSGVEFYRRTFSRGLRRDFHFVFVEMRGTGGSTGSIAGATFASLADDVEAVRRALGLGRAFVMGQSNHGCIAVELALRHPRDCAGAISVASVGDGRGAFERGRQRWEAEASAAQKGDLAARQAALAARASEPMGADERAVRTYVSHSPLGWRDPELAWPCWGGFPAGIGAYLPWIGATLPAWHAALEPLRVPLLAICGRNDYLCPPETWDGFLAVPALRRVVLEHSAHNPQIEEQARFDELVRAFVREHAQGEAPR
jgi:pimeloyl-ACP methyl ester carboxylesterase